MWQKIKLFFVCAFVLLLLLPAQGCAFDSTYHRLMVSLDAPQGDVTIPVNSSLYVHAHSDVPNPPQSMTIVVNNVAVASLTISPQEGDPPLWVGDGQWTPVAAGDYDLFVRLTTAAGDTFDSEKVRVRVLGVPTPAPLLMGTPTPGAATPFPFSLVELRANATSLNAGACTLLHWNVSVPQPQSIDLNGQQVPPQGEAQVCPCSTTRYDLIVLAGDKYAQSVTIEVQGTCTTATAPPPTTVSPVLNFWADTTSLQAGSCTFLHWETNALRVYLDGQQVAASGQKRVCPCNTATYTLAAGFADGSKQERSLTVNVSGSCVIPAPTNPPPPPTQTPPQDTTPPPVPADPGQTYYVAPNGDNANPGTREQPWASPGYGSRQLRPGDTLVILGGRYTLSEYDADILTPPSGTSEAWITITGEEGNRPILAGRNNLATAINLSGVQYVRIANLEITHDDTASGEAAWFREGVEILGAPAAHIILQDLYIHHVDEFGMNIQDVEDLQILNTRIEYAGFGALGGPTGEHGGWRDVVIRGASLSWSGHYYQGGDGSNRPYDRPDGFGIEPSQGPILIEDTLVEHNYGDGLDSKAANTTIRNTIVANNSCDGVKLWGPNSRIENTLIYGRGDGNPEPSPWSAIVIAPEEQANARFEIVNVTVDDYLGHNYLMYVQYDYPNVPAQVVVRNTIFSSRGPEAPIFIAPASTVTIVHTLFFFPQNEVLLTHGGQTYTCANLAGLWAGNLCGDPRFVRPAWGETGDYHLQAGSPAVDRGTSKGAPRVDLEHCLRSTPPDMGAYERCGR